MESNKSNNTGKKPDVSNFPLISSSNHTPQLPSSIENVQKVSSKAPSKTKNNNNSLKRKIDSEK